MKKHQGETQMKAKELGYVSFCPAHEFMLKKGERCCDQEPHTIGCECAECNPMDETPIEAKKLGRI